MASVDTLLVNLFLTDEYGYYYEWNVVIYETSVGRNRARSLQMLIETMRGFFPIKVREIQVLPGADPYPIRLVQLSTGRIIQLTTFEAERSPIPTWPLRNQGTWLYNKVASLTPPILIRDESQVKQILSETQVVVYHTVRLDGYERKLATINPLNVLVDGRNAKKPFIPRNPPYDVWFDASPIYGWVVMTREQFVQGVDDFLGEEANAAHALLALGGERFGWGRRSRSRSRSGRKGRRSRSR